MRGGWKGVGKTKNKEEEEEDEGKGAIEGELQDNLSCGDLDGVSCSPTQLSGIAADSDEKVKQ
jgi:hypothetical protein